MRRFERAYALVKATKDESQLPDDPVVQIVLGFQYDDAAAAYQAKKAERAAKDAAKRKA